MHSRPLILVKRCKLFVSCCRGAMSRWCSRVGILAEFFCCTWVRSAGNSFDVHYHWAYRSHTCASRPM